MNDKITSLAENLSLQCWMDYSVSCQTGFLQDNISFTCCIKASDLTRHYVYVQAILYI